MPIRNGLEEMVFVDLFFKIWDILSCFCPAFFKKRKIEFLFHNINDSYLFTLVKMSNIKGLYPWKRPHPGDYVKCEIIGINMQRGIIEIRLLEYGNLRGYVIFKQMRRGRFRNKSVLGKIKQKFVGQVLSVGTGLQSIEVSKIAVTPEKDVEVSNHFVSLLRLSGFIDKIAKEYKIESSVINNSTFYIRFLNFYREIHNEEYNPEDDAEFTNETFDEMGLYVKDEDDENEDNNEDDEDNNEDDENENTVLKKIAEYAERLFKGEINIEEEFKNLKSINGNEEFYQKFVRRMKNLIRNSTFNLTWNIELISYNDDGVNLVSEYLSRLSNELKKNSIINKKCKSVSLQIVTPPQYQLTMTTKEYEDSIAEIGRILNEIGSITPNVNIQIEPVVSKEIK